MLLNASEQPLDPPAEWPAPHLRLSLDDYMAIVTELDHHIDLRSAFMSSWLMETLSPELVAKLREAARRDDEKVERLFERIVRETVSGRADSWFTYRCRHDHCPPGAYYFRDSHPRPGAPKGP